MDAETKAIWAEIIALRALSAISYQREFAETPEPERLLEWYQVRAVEMISQMAVPGLDSATKKEAKSEAALRVGDILRPLLPKPKA